MAEKSGAHRRRIVIVEDDENCAIIVQYNCAASGYRVGCITNGGDAAEAIVRDPPDLIVLDWILPGISRIQLLRWLKARASTRHIPVVMFAARAEPEDRAYAIASGAGAVLSKTVTVGTLMACISGRLNPDR